MYSLIITDYKTINSTIGYIGRFLKYCMDHVDIVIVDNSNAGEGRAFLDKDEIPYTVSRFKNRNVYRFKKFGEAIYLIDASENGGYSKGNNLGAALSDELFNNPYYIFSNHDVEFRGNFSLESLTKIFHENKDVGVIGPNVIAPDGGRQNPRKSMGFISQMLLQPYNTMWLGCRFNKWLWNLGDHRQGYCGWVSGSFMMVRRESFEKVKGFDESVFLYAEEMILSERLRNQGIHTFYAPQVTVIHHHQGARSNYHARRLNHYSVRYYFKQYKGIREPWLKLSDVCFESAEAVHEFKNRIQGKLKISSEIKKQTAKSSPDSTNKLSYKKSKGGGITYIEKWEKNKELTWSGTPWNILLALRERCEVDERDIVLNVVEKAILKVWTKISALLSINDCGMIEHMLMSKHYRHTSKITPTQPQVIYTEYYHVKPENAYLFIDCSVDFVQRSMDADSEYRMYLPMQKAGHSWINKRSKYATEFYHNCRGIFTMSEWLRTDMIENTNLSPDKVHAIGGGCNIDISSVNVINKKGNRFLFIGKEWERKNGPLVLEAFAQLQHRHGGVELHIAGIERSDNICNRKNVFWHGVLDFGEVSELYNMCDYFVMPSVFEAYGLVFVEALIFGLPCIGANRFAMPEFIRHGKNGYLIAKDTVEELLHYMEMIMENRQELCDYIKENQGLYIKKYNWNTVADRMLEVMREDGYKCL